MQSPPTTPRHSRQSTIDFQAVPSASTSPQANRRQSKSSLHEPSTPLRQSFNAGDSMDVFSSGAVGRGTGLGLGNLADELADALSDDEDDEDEYYDQSAPDISVDLHSTGEGQRDSGVDVAATSPKGPDDGDGGGGGDNNGDGHGRERNMSLSLPTPNGRGHRRAGSVYDGSEYGSDSDLDSPGMPPSLVAKIDAVESLARRGTENNGGPTDGVFQRVTDELRDLGSQSGVEGGATRLITAHSALTTHLTHQTRQLHNLAFPLFSPLVPPPDPETAEELLPVLMSLSEQMPRPSTAAFASLTALHGLTNDLISTLSYLSDTLHMSRQTTITATRRLKSARELVAEMRRDEELREEGERWLTRGNWGERLRKRECASVCGEVVGGFEEVCNGWRARLLAQTESAPA